MVSFFDRIFNRHEEASWMYDLELFQDTSQKAYLKQMALNTCIEFLARTISQSEFRLTDENNKVIKDSVWYKLNTRPNTDLSSTDFWQSVIYKLVYDNEVLIIVTDSKDLVIADDFHRKRFALYPDVFEGVTVGEYEFERSFKMDDVLYLTYNNEKLNKFTEGLFADYGEIFGRMINAQMRNYQIRGIINVDSQKTLDKTEVEKMQNYVNKVTEAFSKNSVAVTPLTKGYEYQDVSTSTKGNNASFDELNKLQKSMIDSVAKAIGIPPSLIHGELADLKNALESYSKFCTKPLNKKIEDELKAKLLTQKEVIKGKNLKVIGIDKKDPLEMAEAIDKLVASSTFTPNQVLVLLGEEPSDDPKMDEYFVTKNYTKNEKGVDESNNSDEEPLEKDRK
ncbi:phage portal protein [Staphylococcus saprophyticus]|uniref:phage portal protein n=1 Tax=Staphylococcus saprophyticus TaxID=29385 RepID=UPI002DBA6432|nr:phage portal protein [Staphylococcus saprophyticus]MEB7998915.1 phage portal protein [Staphylococcus saprophyticus]